MWDRIHAEDQAAIRAAVQQALHAPADGVFQIDFRITHPDGGKRWLSSRGRVVCITKDRGKQRWRIRDDPSTVQDPRPATGSEG